MPSLFSWTYQLLAEALWEYACRAGTTTAYAFGGVLTSGQANIKAGSKETTDVGKYPTNGWGFHDMLGNVFEWCADWYGDYPTGAALDPVGPAGGPSASDAVVPGMTRRAAPVPRFGPGAGPPTVS
jgi:formylglycine-generating enzyme required for sulfatase activity